MNSVVILTEVDEHRADVVSPYGCINQTIFQTIDDALHHLYLSASNGSTIAIKKNPNAAWITVEDDKDTTYYELQIVKPLHYE